MSSLVWLLPVRIPSFSERLALSVLVLAVTALATRAKLVDEIDFEACSTKQRTKSLAFDRLFEFAMLFLRPVAYSYNHLLTRPELVREPLEHVSLALSRIPEPAEIQLAEDWPMIERRYLGVDQQFGFDVCRKAIWVDGSVVVCAEVGLPFLDRPAVNTIVSPLLLFVSDLFVPLNIRFVSALILGVSEPCAAVLRRTEQEIAHVGVDADDSPLRQRLAFAIREIVDVFLSFVKFRRIRQPLTDQIFF